MKSISKELINIIKEKTAEKESAAEFLMNTLPLGKEAVYRRLRGEIALTLDEASIICKKLNISMDLLMGLNQDDIYAFHLDTFLTEKPLEEYCTMLIRIKKSMEAVKDDPSVYLFKANKTIPQEFLYNHEFLSKIYIYILYYHLHTDNYQKIESFSEIEFSEELFSVQQSSITSVHDFNTSLILDQSIFTDFIGIIKYFQFLRMISDSDIQKIKKEMHQLINTMEGCAESGLSLYGKKMNIYISQIAFDCSYTCLESSNFNVSSIGVYCIDYLSCQNQKIHEYQKKWIKSLMRFSTLISVSGELERRKFFQEQRNNIDTML